MRLCRLVTTFLVVTAFATSAFAEELVVKPTVALDYRIYIGGLEALSATVTIGSDAQHYDIEIKAVTAGAIGKVMPWLVHIASKGNVAGDRLQPVEHAQTNNFQGKERSVILSYDGHGGFINRRVMPDAQEDQRDEIPPDMTRDTLDIVSGVLAGLRTVDRTGSCTSRVPVFDGRRRFDLVYNDDGHETLDASGVAMFSGDALKCVVKVEPVAGFWRKNQKKFFSRKVNGEDQVVPIEVFIARVGAAKVEAPVRVESSSPFGPLVMNLQGVHDPE
ncbi:MAG: hypothetical protein JWM91_157 [Rhodospirillales bacterium]|nr:hypothetical protein [Rhodospirillales bacterium]